MAPTAIPLAEASPLLQFKSQTIPTANHQSSTTNPASHPAHPAQKDSDPIPPLAAALASETTPLAVRFRALFSLKHHAALQPADETTVPAIRAIASAFASPSALLKHELAYCLGQSRKAEAVPYLVDVLRDRKQDDMCRHEAAEALGAIGAEGTLPVLKEFLGDKVEVVRETAEIAVARIEWAERQKRSATGAEITKQSDFASVDPAPPVEVGGVHQIEELQRQLMDAGRNLFERYRAMFALRDLASPPDLPTAVPAVRALATGFKDKSALFRHEVAFVYGQLSHPASIPFLIEVLADLGEESMVRHEAAEALGSLGEEEGVEEVLRRYLNDDKEVVRDSVIVALDMAEYERSGLQEYAVLPEEQAAS